MLCTAGISINYKFSINSLLHHRFDRYQFRLLKTVFAELKFEQKPPKCRLKYIWEIL